MGVRTSTLLPCLTLYMGWADAGVATQHGVVTIRTATALPERKVWRLIPIGWWSTADRPCLLGQTIKAQHAFAMAADGDHYILTSMPQSMWRMFTSDRVPLPADARQGLHRCPRPDTRTNWHLYPYNVICRLHARVQRYASRLNKMTWGSVRGLGYG